MKSSGPLGRIVEPDEITKAVFFMATDASSAITGQTIRSIEHDGRPAKPQTDTS